MWRYYIDFMQHFSPYKPNRIKNNYSNFQKAAHFQYYFSLILRRCIYSILTIRELILIIYKNRIFINILCICIASWNFSIVYFIDCGVLFCFLSYPFLIYEEVSFFFHVTSHNLVSTFVKAIRFFFYSHWSTEAVSESLLLSQLYKIWCFQMKLSGA